VEKLLGLEEEEVFEAGALEEGKLYHQVLQCFYAEWDGVCEMPASALDDRLTALHEQALEQLAGEEGLRSLLSPGFRVETPRRLRVLRRFLRWISSGCGKAATGPSARSSSGSSGSSRGICPRGVGRAFRVKWHSWIAPTGARGRTLHPGLQADRKAHRAIGCC